jgi:hypothetical protein
MIEGSGSGSKPLTNGSGSGRPKNIWIRWIRNTGLLPAKLKEATINLNFYPVLCTRITSKKAPIITAYSRCARRHVAWFRCSIYKIPEYSLALTIACQDLGHNLWWFCVYSTLPLQQCSGSVTFWCGSGIRIIGKRIRIHLLFSKFFSGLQDANNKSFFSKIFCFFLHTGGTFTSVFKDNNYEESRNWNNRDRS